MALTCYDCGDTGHTAYECPNKQHVDHRPVWCGICDEKTRHLEGDGGQVKRCQCHPLSHRQLAQHRKCPACHATVAEWDTSPDCQHHILGGVQRPYVGKAARVVEPDEDALRALAAAQVAAARAARAVLP